MKTKVQIYRPQQQHQPRVPLELGNARGAALNNISVDMRLFGITHITTSYRTVGLKTMLDVSFQPMPGNLPASLAACRNTMVRHIGEYMHLFGILDIELMPNDEELKMIESSWQNLQRAPQPDNGTSAIDEQEIELNVESDPTTESVLEPKQVDTPEEPKDEAPTDESEAAS